MQTKDQQEIIYNPDGSDLRKMQLRMMDILHCIDTICKKHDLKYWLSSGTLLGAARHKGFIPWDDDLDIEMLKKDHDKLITILQTELPDEFVLQTHLTDRNYISPLTKVRDTRSLINELNGRDKNFKYRGIFIDIFYLEKANHTLARTAVNLQKFAFGFSLIKNDRFGVLLSIKIFILFCLRNIFFPLLRGLGWLLGVKQYVPNLGTGFTKKRELKEIFPLKTIEFEGESFPSPFDTNAYLTRLYGKNYMTLPPVEKREIHALNLTFLNNQQ